MIDRTVAGWPRQVTQEHLDADQDHAAVGEDDCTVCGLAVIGDGRHQARLTVRASPTTTRKATCVKQKMADLRYEIEIEILSWWFYLTDRLFDLSPALYRRIPERWM